MVNVMIYDSCINIPSHKRTNLRSVSEKQLDFYGTRKKYILCIFPLAFHASPSFQTPKSIMQTSMIHALA
jgi:hypothetical protein